MSGSASLLSQRLVAANQQLLSRRAQVCATVANSAENRVESASRSSGWLSPLTTISAESEPEHSPTTYNKNDTIKLYPDVAIGILRCEMAAAARIWLLLRYLDDAGRGWVSAETARAQLATGDAPLRVCSWRQLRNLLRDGSDTFWERKIDGGKDRIWLRSVARVAARLEVARLNGQPVGIEVGALLGGIGDVRAQLYGSFHSGRSAENRDKPIARDTITAITNISPDSQRAYEKRSGMTVSNNYAIGEVATEGNQKERSWQLGQPVFIFEDRLGKQGQPGQRYLAWQLPNSYSGQHVHQPRGQQKRINRKLADLLITSATGNDEQKIERRYFASGVDALKSQSAARYWRDPSQPRYWRATVG